LTGSAGGEGGKAPGIAGIAGIDVPFGVVGCEDSGPPPGVGGRAVRGGESGGAGIRVPSVREKDTGVIVRGLKNGGAMVVLMYCGELPHSS